LESGIFSSDVWIATGQRSWQASLALQASHSFNMMEVLIMCSILGQHISLIRPAKIARPQTSGAWKQAKSQGRKTRRLSCEQKQLIAKQMGFKLTEANSK